MKKNLKLITGLFFSLFIVSYGVFVSAQEDECSYGPCCDLSISPHQLQPSSYECDDWLEQKCNQDEETEEREATRYCSGDDYFCSGEISYSGWSLTEECDACQPTLFSPQHEEDNIPFPITLDWCDMEGAKSYFLKIYKGSSSEVHYLAGVKEVNSVLMSEIIFDPDPLEVFSANTVYRWQMTPCYNEDFTKCGETCSDEQGPEDCNAFTSEWKFTTEGKVATPPQLTSPFYNPDNPTEISVVNLSDSLSWRRYQEQGFWARSFVYEIKEGSDSVLSTHTTSSVISFDKIWSSLGFDKTYSWHVKGCLNEDGSNCSEFSESWYFKTPPSALEGLEINNDIIPVELTWDQTPGPIFYQWQIASDSGFSTVVFDRVTDSQDLSVDYPQIVPDTSYWIRGRVCADSKGTACDSWAASQSFTTFSLQVPSNPFPEDGKEFLTYQNRISWSKVPGAHFYQYKIDYDSDNPPPNEENERCQELVGQEIVPQTITRFPYAYPSLECLGKYNWYVRACLDEDCLFFSPLATWTFSQVQPIPAASPGIVPCGRDSDHPDTPWDEREPCQFKHSFLVLKTILDFILWRLSLVALVFLTLVTAAIYYLSRGLPVTTVKARSVWKAAGQGYAILLLSWMIINLLIGLLGFTGEWWKISF